MSTATSTGCAGSSTTGGDDCGHSWQSWGGWSFLPRRSRATGRLIAPSHASCAPLTTVMSVLTYALAASRSNQSGTEAPKIATVFARGGAAATVGTPASFVTETAPGAPPASEDGVAVATGVSCFAARRSGRGPRLGGDAGTSSAITTSNATTAVTAPANIRRLRVSTRLVRTGCSIAWNTTAE